MRNDSDLIQDEQEKLVRKLTRVSIDTPHPEPTSTFTFDESIFSPDYPHSYPDSAPFQPQGETLEYDDIRVGLSALNVYGTLGDSSYDPDVFNTFIDEVVAFKLSEYQKYIAFCEEKKHLESSSLSIPGVGAGVYAFTSKSVGAQSYTGSYSQSPRISGLRERASLEEFDQTDFSYEVFRDFVKGRPAWEFLKKHMFLLKDVIIYEYFYSSLGGEMFKSSTRRY